MIKLLIFVLLFTGCSSEYDEYVGSTVVDTYDKDKEYRVICLGGVEYYSSTSRYVTRSGVLSVHYDPKTLKPARCSK